MRMRGQRRRGSLATGWVAALVALVLLVMVVASASHVVAAPLFVVLSPVFLFAMIEIEDRSPIYLEREELLPPEPVRPSLFQRPPPLFS